MTDDKKTGFDARPYTQNIEGGRYEDELAKKKIYHRMSKHDLDAVSCYANTSITESWADFVFEEID